MRWLLRLLLLTTSSRALATHVEVQMGPMMASLPDVSDVDRNELLRVSRARVAAHDYDQAIRSFQRAFECMENANADTAIARLYEDDRVAFQLHYEYAELLRMRVLPRISAGDIQADAWKRDAIRHYQQALMALSDPMRPGDRDASRILHIFNTIGLLLFELRDLEQALQFFQHATAVDPKAVEPHGNTILVLSGLGDMDGALRYARRAQEMAPHDPRLLHNIGMILYNLHRDHEAAGVWLRAMESDGFGLETPASLGMYYGEQGDCPKALFYLTQAMQMAALNSSKRQSATESYNALRLKLATAQLPMVYDSSSHIDQARAAYSASLGELALASESGSFRLPKDPVMTVGSGSMGYYAIYQGFNDAAIRSQLARIYRNAMPQLSYTAPHLRRWRHKRFVLQQLNDQPEPPDMVILRRRIRVGFHSAFMRHHSVGILTQGVIKRLSRAKFEVVLILEDSDLADTLTRDVIASADVVMTLSKDLARAQQQISGLQLDVLVFTEIGMHSRTYFLAFAQLALRTAMFWGHAVTSGIDSIDYFISSTLFHSPSRPDGKSHGTYKAPMPPLQDGSWHDAGKYTECVYRMQHFTAYVDPPPLLSQAFQSHAQQATFRSSLGLPSEGTMFLVPQTLYKLNPALDPIIERILGDLHDVSFLVLPTGAKPLLVSQLTARWRRRLSEQVYKRIFFVRALNETEFLALCATADIVLDSFPVGGGRSSIEIFSVGTPVVVHVTRTTIPQLTAAMYRTMGISGSGLLAFTDDEYVENAIRLARNATLRQQLKQRILANKHKLFRREAVVSEWETFLLNIMASTPPTRSTTGVDSTQKECPTNVQLSSTARIIIQKNDGIEFQMLVTPPAIDPYMDMDQSALVSLRKGEDPFLVAERFGAQFEPQLEILQVAYVGKILWNMRRRRSQVLVWQCTLVIPKSAIASEGRLPMRYIQVGIRYGDDLEPIIRWQILDAIRRQRNVLTVADWRYIASLTAVRGLIHEAVTRAKIALPQFRTPQWRAVRVYSDPATTNKMPGMPELRANATVAEDSIALLVTTCKRLDLFMRTMMALEVALSITEPSGWSRWFSQLLVVDDNSSSKDRNAMAQRFPTFEFIFKTQEQRGHARSMQLGLARVTSRYLLYLEDDWVAHESLRAACQGVNPTACFLREALAVLQHQGDEQVALVLLNDHQSGWARSIITSDNRFVQFCLHEFAVADATHSFAYWPGFSFNPGLWDLSALRVGLRQEDTNLWFDTEIDIFERMFALRVWHSGLRVAFATGERFTHTGTNGSAYVLNGLPRRFDS